MDASVKADFKRALAQGNVNRYATAYLEARLREAQDQLVVANDVTFRQTQGRCQELQDLLKLAQQASE